MPVLLHSILRALKVCVKPPNPKSVSYKEWMGIKMIITKWGVEERVTWVAESVRHRFHKEAG